MATSRQRAGLVAIIGALALLIVVLARGSHEEAVPKSAPPSAATDVTSPPTQQGTRVAPAPNEQVAPAPHDEVPSVDEVIAAKGSTAPGAVTLLIAGLSSDDAVTVAESANELVARGALSAIPALLDLDVAARPWAAPSAIYAMGALATKADADDRAALVDHLLALLAQEKQRTSADALANLLQIYEALGQTHDPRAIAPLERELADPSVTTAPKVVIVQALVELAARGSRPALERLRDEIAPGARGPDFEAELKRDLLAAIDAALERLA